MVDGCDAGCHGGGDGFADGGGMGDGDGRAARCTVIDIDIWRSGGEDGRGGVFGDRSLGSWSLTRFHARPLVRPHMAFLSVGVDRGLGGGHGSEARERWDGGRGWCFGDDPCDGVGEGVVVDGEVIDTVRGAVGEHGRWGELLGIVEGEGLGDEEAVSRCCEGEPSLCLDAGGYDFLGKEGRLEHVIKRHLVGDPIRCERRSLEYGGNAAILPC